MTYTQFPPMYKSRVNSLCRGTVPSPVSPPYFLVDLSMVNIITTRSPVFIMYYPTFISNKILHPLFNRKKKRKVSEFCQFFDNSCNCPGH